MAATLPADLLQQVRDAERDDPQRAIPVIVNLAPGASPTTLSQQGLQVTHEFEAISAVSGTATAAQVRRLATLAQVLSIDYDSTAHTLDHTI